MQQGALVKTHFVGAVLMIAGCCIGAGMLGLPLITAFAGFLPASIVLFLSWIFMLATGLLLAEVYFYFNDNIGFISMAKRTLGKTGEVITWATFLFLFYCLLTAYVSGLGSMFQDLFRQSWLPLLALIALLGFFIYLGTGSTDRINRLLMVGLVVTYVALVIFSLPYVEGRNLTFVDWKETWFIIPPFVISFGFHNLVPSLGAYLKRNANALRWAIILGSSITFFVYWIWEFILLGMIPVEGEQGFLAARELGLMPAQILKKMISNPYVAHSIDLFSFFAITTSFVTMALSVTDFLADGLKMPKDNWMRKFALCVLAILPPVLFALSDPRLFLIAIKRAGGIGFVILFGMLPVLMAWKGRYKLGLNRHPMIRGGKPALILIGLVSVLIFVLHIVDEFR